MFQRKAKSANPNLEKITKKEKKKDVEKCVRCCIKCDLVSICERTRTACPYCGSFFDSRLEKDHSSKDEDQKGSHCRRSSLSLTSMNDLGHHAHRSRLNSFSRPNSQDISNNTHSESEDSSVDLRTNSAKIKLFFKNLIKLTNKQANSCSNPNLNNVEHFKLKPMQNNARNVTNESVDDPKMNRFLTINASQRQAIFDEYRNSESFVASKRDFHNLYRKSVETGSFDLIGDFYYWMFSRSANLIELLTNEKPTNSCYYVSVNWNFMKEIYNCLVKMPDEVIKQAHKSISFCIANDLRPFSDELKLFFNHKKSSTTNNNNVNEETTKINKKTTQVVYGYLIFLCNPLLDLIENNPLFSLLLNSIVAIGKDVKNSFIYAMRKMPLSLFREVLRHVQNFLVIRYIPNRRIKLLPLATDWLGSSVKMLAILHCTNELQIQYYQNHYNEYLDDAMAHLREKEMARSRLGQQLNKLKSDETVSVDLEYDLPLPLESLTQLVSASTTSSSLFVSFKEFYVRELDFIDLYKEYSKWLRIGDSPIGFSFCQYPFLLSIEAKMKILKKDSEEQMISIAKRSYLNSNRMRHNLAPNSTDLFLTLKVRRNYIISDSLNEIEAKKSHLKKKLRVNFIGEAAIDMGGVRKEWFLLLIRKIFSPVYGMFSYIKESNVYWFSASASIESSNNDPQAQRQQHQQLSEYYLVGVLMGLAVYNGEILDIHLPPCVYKKLAVFDTNTYLSTTMSFSLQSQSDGNGENSQTIGICTDLSLYDLRQVMPCLAASLQQLLDYEGNVGEDFGMTFCASYSDQFDVVRTVELKPNGNSIELTNENRKEYVDLYVDFLLNRLIYKQFKAFYMGFHSVCASNSMILFRPEEIELVVCGSQDLLNINDLKRVSTYENYSEKDEIICWFWDTVRDEFDLNQKKRLLLFATGSDRIPVGGTRDMQFKIIRVESKNQLPMAHTCFNQLILPNYADKNTLKTKLLIAIENAEGFGFK